MTVTFVLPLGKIVDDSSSTTSSSCHILIINVNEYVKHPRWCQSVIDVKFHRTENGIATAACIQPYGCTGWRANFDDRGWSKADPFQRPGHGPEFAGIQFRTGFVRNLLGFAGSWHRSTYANLGRMQIAFHNLLPALRSRWVYRPNLRFQLVFFLLHFSVRLFENCTRLQRAFFSRRNIVAVTRVTVIYTILGSERSRASFERLD